MSGDDEEKMGIYGCCKEDWTVFFKKKKQGWQKCEHVLFDSIESRKETGRM